MIFETVSRSGSLILKVDRPFNPETVTENDIFHFGFTPNDIKKIIVLDFFRGGG